MAQAKAAAWIVTYFMSAPIFWLTEQGTFRLYFGAFSLATWLLRRCVMVNPETERPRWRTLRLANRVISLTFRFARWHKTNHEAFEEMHAQTMAAIIAAR